MGSRRTERLYTLQVPCGQVCGILCNTPEKAPLCEDLLTQRDAIVAPAADSGALAAGAEMRG